MVTVNEFVGINVESGMEKREYEFKGLSTDTKPTYPQQLQPYRVMHSVVALLLIQLLAGERRHQAYRAPRSGVSPQTVQSMYPPRP